MKAKDHRALLADDQKAYRMIVAEYGRQAILPAEEVAKQKEIILCDAVARIPDTLAAWYAGKGEFVILVSEDSRAFVHEQVWGVECGVPVMLRSERWVLPKKSDYLRWEMIYSTPAWTERPENPKPKDWLPGDQFEKVVEWVRANPPKAHRAKKPEEVIGIYAVQGDKKMEIKIATLAERERGWDPFNDRKKEATRMGILAPAGYPDFHTREVTWEQKKGEYIFGCTGFWTSSTSTYYDHSSDKMVWGWEGSERSLWSKDRIKLLWVDEEKRGVQLEVITKCDTHNARASKLCEWWHELEESAEEFLKSAWENLEREKFLKDGGDEEFFADHLKTVQRPEIDLGDQNENNDLALIILKCINFVDGEISSLVGLTLADAMRVCGVKIKKPTADLITLVKSNWELAAPTVQAEQDSGPPTEDDDEGEDDDED